MLEKPLDNLTNPKTRSILQEKLVKVIIEHIANDIIHTTKLRKAVEEFFDNKNNNTYFNFDEFIDEEVITAAFEIARIYINDIFLEMVDEDAITSLLASIAITRKDLILIYNEIVISDKDRKIIETIFGN